MSSNQPTSSDSAIAIVGMAGSFPGARTIAEYWENLRSGVCSISDFTERELLDDGADPAVISDPSYVPSKGWLADADVFEAELFGFNPAEARVLDPQHRLLLQTAWTALEDAGYAPGANSGPAAPGSTGVYVGGSLSEHMLAAQYGTGVAAELGEMNVRILTDRDFLAPWISYRLGLDGPSMTVQTACSTSLTAVHLAVQALLLGECDTALAGGVSVDSVRKRGYLHQQGGVGSPDGRCRPFDEGSSGTLTGNGVGLVVLRRLSDALADGDPVHAVIRGSAVTNDGRAKVGFTAPGVAGQAAAIAQAWAAAGLRAADAQYLEMHGTGTALGDQIEVAAVTEAFGPDAERCLIGSVKSNIGHLDAAAGIAGLIKVVLMLSHRILAPTVNVTTPRAELKLDSTPFELVSRTSRWETDGSPRRAGVSSVGIGGTNVHVVLEEAPEQAAPQETDSPARPHLLVLSARTTEQAATVSRELEHVLRDPDGPSLSETAQTLRSGRTSLDARAFVVAASREEAVHSLTALPAAAHGIVRATGRPGSPVFLFPGQGSQYPSVGQGLYEYFPVFRSAVDRCAKLLVERHGIDCRPWRGTPDRAGTRYWQATLFSLEYAAASLWQSLGIEPGAMVGHSIGEYAAACLSGVFTLEDTLELIVARGELMDRTEPGRMLAVRLPETEVTALLGPDVQLAAVNGPGACVLSGTGESHRRVAERLAPDRTAHRYLDVDRAFHSRLMEPAAEEFAARVKAVIDRVGPATPVTPYVSSVTGTWITAEQATDPHYWADQMRLPVRYAAAVATAASAAAGPLLEVGPADGLATQIRQALPGRRIMAALGRRAGEEAATFLRSLGELWSLGHDITWPEPAGPTPRRVHLPTYPFVGERYGALALPTVDTAVGRAPAERQDRTVANATSADRMPAGGAKVSGPPDTRSRVTDLLMRTLGLSGPDDLRQSYFAVGGDSLTAVHIVSRLRDDFAVDVPVTLFLEQTSLHEVAERIVLATEESSREDDELAALLGEIAEAPSGDGVR